MKTCTKCGRRRRLSSFHSNGNGRVASACKDCRSSHQRAYSKARSAADPNFHRRKNEKYKSRRGWKRTEEAIQVFRHLMKKQKGLCAICGKKETHTYRGEVRALAMDHCHETGAWRGLLCSNCNLGLGQFMDDPNVLEAAAAYLREHAASNHKVV